MKSHGHTLFTLVTALLVMASFALAFLYAPNDANLGVVQKVFYFHLSSAITMYVAFIVCAVASILYLARKKEKWDMVASSAGEIALVFGVILMTTGPIWGRKSWGAYWAWDPRLTSALLLVLIIVAYVVLRSLASSGGVERKFGAALAILGAALIPIIHISVRKWRGQHPTVITPDGGGLADEMWVVLILSLIGFTALFVLLILQRYGLKKNKRLLKILEEESGVGGGR